MGKKHWEIIVHRKAEKTIKRLRGEMLERMRKAISALAEEPRPSGYKKMTGHKELYRIRVGQWRIIYKIEDEKLIILILTIAPRGSVYRKY